MITIAKAIEILEAFMRGDEPDYSPDLPASVKLGIAALKRLELLRSNFSELGLARLPGETPE